MNGNRDPLLKTIINPRWWRLPGEGRSNAKWNVSLQFLPSDLLLTQKWRSRFSPLKKDHFWSFTNGSEPPGDPWVFCSKFDDVHLSGFAELLRALNHFDPQQVGGNDNVGRWSVEVQTWNGPGWCFLIQVFLKWPFWAWWVFSWPELPGYVTSNGWDFGYKKVILNHLNLLGGWAPSGM